MKISNFQIHFWVFLATRSVLSSESLQTDHLPSSRKPVAFFIFGDSVFDPGNNNYINTIEFFRANFSPYGETFFKFPTGRFCDGRLIPDFIAEYAKLPLIPPYLDPHNSQYIHGVNFASGGAGALVESYKGLVIDLKTQLSYFKNVVKSLRKRLGDAKACSLMFNSIYLFSIGGNDYFVPFEPGSTVLDLYSEIQYVNMVIGNLTSVIEEIYKKGGRKFGFVNIAPLGCLPNLRLRKPEIKGACFEEMSSLAKLHNKLLSQALQKLAIQLKGFKYSFTDLYTLLVKRMNNPSKYGFKEGKAACCGSGQFRGIYSCGGRGGMEEYELCENPSEYLFFDSAHPTEKAYQQFAKLMWSGDAYVTKPHNLKQLFEYDMYE